MMELSKHEEQEIAELLVKRNKAIWTPHVIQRVITRINKIRQGFLKVTDWYLEDAITLEDYFLQLNLTKYL